MRPLRILDLFCCAGAASEGYRQAGFEPVGVDIDPQPRYPFPFIQADALALDPRFFRHFDAIHASPPCQFGTTLRHAPNGKQHPNLIPATRAMLEASGLPYVIENVDAPDVRPHMPGAVRLCGSHFGLGAAGHQLRRHRLFQANFPIPQPKCAHHGPVIGVYGGHVRNRAAKAGGRGTRDFIDQDKPALAKQAMGITWATMQEMSEAIPPAYAAFVGLHLARHIREQGRAAA